MLTGVPLSMPTSKVSVSRRGGAWAGNGRAKPRAPMHDAALTREVAVRSRSVRVEHGDPADRFLAATADVYELTLVTGDERLLRGKGFRTLANR